MKMFETYHGILSNDNSQIQKEREKWAYYEIDTRQFSIQDNEDLVIQLTQAGLLFTDSSMFIDFVTIKYDNTYCKQELKNVSLIQIGVYCQTYCQFQIQAELSVEKYLQAGQTNKFSIKENQELILKVYIPEDNETHTIEFIGASSIDRTKLTMILTPGNKVPNSQNGIFFESGWEDKMVLKITQQNTLLFCKGCNYTILISSDQNSVIMFSSKLMGSVVDLNKQGGMSLDYIEQGMTQVYSYNIINNQKDLRLKLEVFSGNPNMYISPKQLPENIFQSIYNSKDHFFDEELRLTPQKRAENNAQSGIFMIAVYGFTRATYKITIVNEDGDNYLKNGLSQSNYLNQSQIAHYYFQDPLLADQKTHFQLQVHQILGSIKYLLKICPLEFNDTKEIIEQKCNFKTQELADAPELRRNAHHISQQERTANHETCKLNSAFSRNTQISCIYVIGVYGVSQNPAHYSVVVKLHDRIYYQQIKEGKPYIGESEQSVPQYFQFKVEDINTTKVIIQLTTNHGNPNLYSTKDILPFHFQNFQDQSMKEGLTPEIITYVVNENQENLKTLTGDYYIVVFSRTSSSFTLLIYTESSEKDQLPIKLYSGQKQQAVIDKQSESLLFYFEFSEQFEDIMEIILNSEFGHLQMLLGLDYIPSSITYSEKGDNMNPIKIKVNQTQMRKTQILYILRGYLKENQINHYQIQLDYPNNGYIIQCVSLSGNPNIVATLNNSILFPTIDQFDLKSDANTPFDTIIIPPIMIDQFEQRQNSILKYIVVGVYSDEKNSALYDIMAIKNNASDIINILLGKSYSFRQEMGQDQFFKLQMKKIDSFLINVEMPYGQLYLDIIIKNKEEKPEIDQYEYPDLQAHFTDHRNFKWIGAVDPILNYSCDQGCYIFIRARGVNTIVDNNQQNLSISYIIFITKDKQELRDDKEIRDAFLINNAVIAKQYTFQKIQDDSDLEIEFKCDMAYLQANLQIQFTNMLGLNYASWNFSTKDQDTKILIPSNHSKYKNHSTKGKYSIIVSSHLNLWFRIKIRQINLNEISQTGKLLYSQFISIGQSYILKLDPNENQLLQFTNFQNSSLSIRYDVLENNPTNFAYNYIEVNLTKLARDKKEHSKLIESNRLKSNYIYIPTNDSDFCMYCQYLISIKNLRKDIQQKIQFVASQDSDSYMGYIQNIVVGRPNQIRMKQNEKTTLQILNAKQNAEYQILVQYFYGQGNLKVLHRDQILIQHPNNLVNIKENNRIPFQKFESINSVEIKFNLDQIDSYQVLIESIEELYCYVLVTTEYHKIKPIIDGTNQMINLQPNSSQYFFYVPSSSKFQLSINGKITKKNSYMIFIGQASDDLINDQRKLKQFDLKGNFDYVIRNSRYRDIYNVYTAIQTEMKENNQVIVIKVISSEQNLNDLDLKLTLSGSEVQYLFIGQTTRGHVSNFERTFMIYEVFINQNINKNQDQDLYIQVTPCNGMIDLFVSESYLLLFDPEFGVENKMKINSTINDQDNNKFGLITKTIKNVNLLNSDYIYMGIQSSNEFYSEYQNLSESYFEIKVSLIPSSQQTLVEKYQFEKDQKEIEISTIPNDQDHLFIKWVNIYENKGDYVDKPMSKVQNVQFKLYGSRNKKLFNTFQSMCSIQHSKEQSIILMKYDASDKEKQGMKIKKSDIQYIKLVGLVAQFKDEQTGEMVSLAYDPYIVEEVQYGVQINPKHLIIMIVGGILILIFLVFISCMLRVRSKRLLEKLENQRTYNESSFDQTEADSQQTN